MSIYTSQGTIRIHHCISESSKPTIYFIPENDYSIKHRNENYAVFVPLPQSCKNAVTVIRRCNPDKGDKIKIEIDAARINCMDIISSAAMHQKKVEVEVEVKTTLEEMKREMQVIWKKLVENEISKIVEKIAKEADDNKKKEAMKQEMEVIWKELMKVEHESKQCLKLVGITVPAQ